MRPAAGSDEQPIQKRQRRQADQPFEPIRIYVQQMEQFPTLVDDIRLWGWPSSLRPLPTWTRWRVDVWWYFDEYSRFDRGWHIQETLWFSRVPDLRKIVSQVFTTAGLYTHRRFELSLWAWDYDDPWWQEQDHV